MNELRGMKPERPIRRFDVFAEYRKQEKQAKGRPADEAMGYGLWVAKLVAAWRFGGGAPRERRGRAFYHRVFAPTIEDARAHGKSYESIRDTIRGGGKPG